MNLNQEHWRKNVETEDLLKHVEMNHTDRMSECVDTYCINRQNLGVDTGNAFCSLFSCKEYFKWKTENKYTFATIFLE